jgi:CRISPR system Cascade subunit CasC
MTPGIYVDVHIIQTVPPSNINRDDAGSPKQAMYGGVRRSRVSSQAWKRATRIAFDESVPRADRGTRTKRISGLLAERLVERGVLDIDQATRIASHLLSPLGISAKKKAAETDYLLFFGRSQLEQLVDLVAGDARELAGLSDEDLDARLKVFPVTECLSSGHPVDVALFGRMVADIPGLNVDAAAQVAHALSTHAVEIEFDYYTAVDDERPKDEQGASMIGTVEFSSATLYRFATVGLYQLLENLGGDVTATLEALGLFLRSFSLSLPTGHQNSFGHRTVPSLVCVAIREDQPVNLVSAFESPVRSATGTVEVSVDRLAGEMRRVATAFGLRPAFVATTYQQPVGKGTQAAVHEAFGDPLPLNKVIKTTLAAARKYLKGVPAR